MKAFLRSVLPSLVLVTFLGSCGKSPPEVLLTWSDNADDEECFVIERRQGDGEYELLALVDKDCQAYVDRSVGRGEAYQYQIRAGNRAGCSSPVTSNVLTVTPPNAARVPVESCAALATTESPCGRC